jgi:putative membrane protein
MMHGFGYGGCGGGIGVIFMGIFWIVVICLIVWGAVRMGRRGYWMHSGHMHGGYNIQNPLYIAKERYAKGEIDKEQYEQLKKDLS